VGSQDVDLEPDSSRLPALRPQTLVLTLFGDYVLGRSVCVYSGSLIDAAARVGVAEHAARSTLTRMVNRGLLRRRRGGRRMYFGLTERSETILLDGRRRALQTGAVNHDWDGTWTLLAFSLPDAWQRQRRDLRAQLGWAGFGPLQGGLWIAPGGPDVAPIVAGLGLDAHVRVFRAHADQLTDVAQMIRDAYDVEGLARVYRDFLARWEHVAERGPSPDPFAAKLRLVADWLQLVRRDPHLPFQHLPADWPARWAQQVFTQLDDALREPAAEIAARVLEMISDDRDQVSACQPPISD
jgi:phenylacetic acid degradation operon negative regulatory protein